jgi:hypothetical protein
MPGEVHMKKWSAFTAVFLALLAAPAIAGPEEDYQRQLLARPITSGDAQLCKQIQQDEGGDYDACHITRNFVIDINAKGTRTCPPRAHIRYANSPGEQQQISDRCTR